MHLKEWLAKVEARVEKAQAAGQEVGACMIPDPNGGPPICVLADKATCTQVLTGTYLGGDCGV